MNVQTQGREAGRIAQAPEQRELFPGPPALDPKLANSINSVAVQAIHGHVPVKRVRRKLDEVYLHSLFAMLGNKSAVARRAGLHRNTVIRILKIGTEHQL